MGKLAYMKEAIDYCADIGAYAIKFQLFPNRWPWMFKTVGTANPEPTGNVWLDPEHLHTLFDYAKGRIKLTASVFDKESLDLLIPHKPAFIKFAHSQKHQEEWIRLALHNEIEAIVSCDVMTDHEVPLGAKKLYCIPEYPVRYQIDFEGLFPRFDGFSSHTLGIHQDEKAIMAGARMIEKHFTLPHPEITCPDSRFALNIREMRKLASICRYSS